MQNTSFVKKTEYRRILIYVMKCYMKCYKCSCEA